MTGPLVRLAASRTPRDEAPRAPRRAIPGRAGARLLDSIRWQQDREGGGSRWRRKTVERSSPAPARGTPPAAIDNTACRRSRPGPGTPGATAVRCLAISSVRAHSSTGIPSPPRRPRSRLMASKDTTARTGALHQAASQGRLPGERATAQKDQERLHPGRVLRRHAAHLRRPGRGTCLGFLSAPYGTRTGGIPGVTSACP